MLDLIEFVENSGGILTFTEAKDALGLTAPALHYHLKNGTAPPHYRLGKMTLFRKADLSAWNESRKQGKLRKNGRNNANTKRDGKRSVQTKRTPCADESTHSDGQG